jgi:hypothetical protein
VFFRVDIHVNTYHRLLQLTEQRVTGVPDWIEMGQSTVASKRSIATTDPSWFSAFESKE